MLCVLQAVLWSFRRALTVAERAGRRHTGHPALAGRPTIPAHVNLATRSKTPDGSVGGRVLACNQAAEIGRNQSRRSSGFESLDGR